MRTLFGLAFALCSSLLFAASASASPEEVVSGLFDEGAQAVEWREATIDLNRLKPYYAAEGATFVWIENGKLTKAGSELISLFERAVEDGLNPKDYTELAFAALDRLSGEEDEAGAELALSQSFLRLARDLSGGRTSPSLNSTKIVIERKTINAERWLTIARTQGATVAVSALRPAHNQYRRLQKLLTTYRSLAALGGWEQVPLGPALKPGMRDARVALMRDSLAARGYKGLTSADPALYDPALLNAVKTFQLNNSVEDDGIAGKGTLSLLNVPVDDRIRQIIVNMETLAVAAFRSWSAACSRQHRRFRALPCRRRQDS